MRRTKLRQGVKELDAIRKFEYDLEDEWFLLYFRLRCCVWIDDEKCKYLKSRKKKKKFTWQQIMKAKVQDCWEIYEEMTEDDLLEFFEDIYRKEVNEIKELKAFIKRSGTDNMERHLAECRKVRKAIKAIIVED